MHHLWIPAALGEEILAQGRIAALSASETLPRDVAMEDDGAQGGNAASGGEAAMDTESFVTKVSF